MKPLFIVCCAALLAACTLLGPQHLPPLPLLPPAELGQSMQLSQRVEVRFEDRSSTFLGAWVVDSERLDFVGLTPSGQRLFTLGHGPGGFSENYSPLLEEAIPGREVLSHLQLAHWPMASIEGALRETPWSMSVEGGARNLYLDGRLILSIAGGYTDESGHRLPRTIHIRSHVAAYQLSVETLQVVQK